MTRIPLSPFPLTPEAMADHDRATGRWTDHRADSLADPVRDPLPQPTATGNTRRTFKKQDGRYTLIWKFSAGP